MSKARIEVNRNGILELLQSAAVASDLEGRGNRIASAAGGSDDFSVRVTKNRDRAVVFVTTATREGRLAEAENRALTSAIGAGR